MARSQRSSRRSSIDIDQDVDKKDQKALNSETEISNEDNEVEEKEKSQENDSGKEQEDDKDEEEEEEEEEAWDLKHVHTIEEIESQKIKCMTNKCPLIACTTYVSSLDPTNVWYSCLDCQEKDYGGWPTDLKEIPIKFMTERHREVMSEKCTGRYSPNMPNLPMLDPSNLNSPLPASQKISTKIETSLETKTQPEAKNPLTVTPPPGQRKRPVTTTTSTVNDTKSKSKKVTPIPSKPSNQALAVHRKWQDAAKALGGERIVVSKPAAKKLIFDMLKDSFRPMNITTIFKVCCCVMTR